MTRPAFKRAMVLLPIMAPLLLTACVVWKSDYDAVVAQNQQLQQQVAADKVHITRLQDAIKYTVNSDLLFSSGGWQLSADGKDVIAKMAKMLAPGQQDHLVVNGYTDNAPIGPGLQRMGVASNQVLSQKRAETVMQYMISQGVKPELVSARGHGEADPIAPNNTAQGRAQNRRVEITLAHGS
jgi:chemotaxis protein MotB